MNELYFFVRMTELFAISILNSGHSSLQTWKSCSRASLSRIKDSKKKKNLDILNSKHFPDLSLYNDTYSVTDYRLHRALDISNYFTFPLRAGDNGVQLKATPNKMGATIQFFSLPIWIFRAESWLHFVWAYRSPGIILIHLVSNKSHIGQVVHWQESYVENEFCNLQLPNDFLSRAVGRLTPSNT